MRCAPIDGIRRAADVPMLVGGTMLYFKALREGLTRCPQPNAGVRAALDAARRATAGPRCTRSSRASIRRPPRGCAERRAAHPARARGARADRPAAVGAARAPRRRQRRLGPPIVDRAGAVATARALHARIARALRRDARRRPRRRGAARCARAMALTPAMPSMRCVGYRQAWEYLDGEIDRDALRERGIAATRQLAKRQLTWLRGMAVRPRRLLRARTSSKRRWRRSQAGSHGAGLGSPAAPWPSTRCRRESR